VTGHSYWMTEANLSLARRLWDEGVATREIALQVGCYCTKSAIVGYAHRQGWPPRPSPVAGIVRVRKPDGPHHKAAPKPVRARKPPPLMSTKTILPKPPTAPVALPVSAFRSCQWIEGNDRRTWTMCGAPTVPGSAYCSSHFARCYHRPPRLAEAA
jgi:hypothetical protein